MRKTIAASILLGVLPLALAACSGATSSKTAETTNANNSGTTDSRMAQMGDGSIAQLNVGVVKV